MSNFSNPWRVQNLPLTWEAVLICKLFGLEPMDFAGIAIREYIKTITGEWGNVETFAIIHEIKIDKEWRAAAARSDDYKDFLAEMKYLGVDETRTGVRLKDPKIARQRVSKYLRTVF